MGVTINEIPGFTATVSNTNSQNPCSYEQVFVDTTSVSNGSYNRGTINYYSNGTLIGSVQKGQSFVFQFQGAGSFAIKQEFIITQLNFDGADTGIPIYKHDEEFSITILEYQPVFMFPITNGCYTRDTKIDILPSTITLNNNVCGILPENNTGYKVSNGDDGTYAASYYANFNRDFQTLQYRLYRYDLDSAQWLEITEAYQRFAVTSTNVFSYEFKYETEVLGTYRLDAQLQNCCQLVEDSKVFTTCDTLLIENSCIGKIECNTCNTFVIRNSSLTNYEIEIWDEVRKKKIHTITSEQLTKSEFTFTEDGVYSFRWDNKASVVLVSCAIDACYTNLLQSRLCAEKSGCCDDRFLDSRLAEVQALWQTYMRLVEPYLDLNVRFSLVDLNASLQDFLEIGKIQKYLLEICDVCKRNCAGCFEYKSSCI